MKWVFFGAISALCAYEIITFIIAIIKKRKSSNKSAANDEDNIAEKEEYKE